MYSTVVLGLGSNWGDRRAMLNSAIAALSRVVEEMTQSTAYENPALLPPGAPDFWNRPYLNMAVAGHTRLDPDKLLSAVKSIENRLGRQDRGYWGPREIDIDILAYDDQIVNTEELTIPHRELLRRSFALVPFAEIMPLWKYPAPGIYQGKTAEELVKYLSLNKDKTLRKVAA